MKNTIKSDKELIYSCLKGNEDTVRALDRLAKLAEIGYKIESCKKKCGCGGTYYSLPYGYSTNCSRARCEA